ncbi:MAG: glycine C-acetyltransferase [Acidobacteria bacterium]|nr:glycine C-acetyltransferase [Acidobacteriota bacterium]
MYTAEARLQETLFGIRAEGLYKSERVMSSAQGTEVTVGGGQPLINLCANNYVGLANHPAIVQAAHDALDKWGYGLASVRFICGTQELHKQLERRISEFLGTEDTILYGSCFDANGGLFETLLDAEDAVVSDELNHASIIDGIRLCKAKRFRYRNGDMADLEAKLTEAQGSRQILIATDGVFSMDGYIAKLPEICELAARFGAMVMVDDSHAVGFIGAQGRGTPEHCGVMDKVDIITGTLGKALGGASGGYTSGRKAVIDLLRQRSRPYLFSNSVPPPIAGASLKVLELLSAGGELRERVHANAALFRSLMTAHGFDLLPGEHPIIPVMLHDATVATRMAEKLLARGVYVIAFSYPVVPKGRARIRVQVSAAHTTAELEYAAAQFTSARDEMQAAG